MQSQVQEVPAAAAFNKRTHYHNARGKLTKTDHYRLHMQGHTQYFERPINSGNLWFENGEPAGRVEFTLDEKTKKSIKKIHPEAEHKFYSAPLEGAEKLSFENQELAESNAKLSAANEAALAELAAIKAELSKKDSDKKQPEHVNNIGLGVSSGVAGQGVPSIQKVAPPVRKQE